VIIGDPLCAPFARTTVPAVELDPPVDKDTELPSLFSSRRLASLGAKYDVAAQKLFLKAEVREARGDRAAARQALEDAVARDESIPDAWRTLGIWYDTSKEVAKAITAYRKATATEPKDWISLNNLAYLIAVSENKPADALGLAEQALQLSGGSLIVADTVGWIKHLLGDDAGAIKLIAPAAKGLRDSADVQLHAAVVFAAMGRNDDATAALKAAEAADPAVKNRPEYREAQQKIGR
jgi:Tfp pilus assembly protein PilF